MEKQWYTISFQAKLSDSDVRAMKNCFFEAMETSMCISECCALDINYVENKKYYFTYGTENQVHEGGWDVVHAHDVTEARKKWRAYYGAAALDELGLMRFSFCYSEEDFVKTRMATEGNLGHFQHTEIY